MAVEPPAGETVDGLRNLDDGYIPPIFIRRRGKGASRREAIVRPRESIEWTRRLRDVGIFAGLSSGAALARRCKLATTVESGTIVVVAADGDGSISPPERGPTGSTWSRRANRSLTSDRAAGVPVAVSPTIHRQRIGADDTDPPVDQGCRL